MLQGLGLIAAGVGILVTARFFAEDASAVNRELARRALDAGEPRAVVYFHRSNAWLMAVVTPWYGRLVGIAAIVAGLALVVGA